MDKYFKIAIAYGIMYTLTNNLVIAISAGWFVYFYEKQKENNNDTIIK